MNIELTPKKIMCIYFITPILFGLLLSDLFGIDVSDFFSQYLGMLKKLELAGYDIQFKAMSLLILLLLYPAAQLALPRFITQSAENIAANLRLSNLMLLVLSLFLFSMTILVAVIFMIGLDVNEIQSSHGYTTSAARLFVVSVKSDVLFSLFSTFMISFAAFSIYGSLHIASALWIRIMLRNQRNS